MSPTLPPFTSFALVTQLKSWTTALSFADGKKFLQFWEDENTFPSTGITDGPDIVYHLVRIVEATTSFETLHQRSEWREFFHTADC